MEINRLFVYGTLAPGESNEHFLKALKGSWQKAYVNGKLYKNGIGPTQGYPALLLNIKADSVQGMLFRSEQLPSLWHTLDEFEGEGYIRVECNVRLEDNTTIDAYIYALDPNIVSNI
ncbi:MAG: gamma-glutamylcyclotransferase [Gammaproteobacteria bacterium]|nr:gamma-glutamylcyclotransferase [Gammaproteobacteria bacterium]